MAAIAALLLLLASNSLARVPDGEMAPSLLTGDLVVVLPLTPRPGDVVAVVDPLDGGRWTLRRVVAGPGNVAYEHGAFIVDDAPPQLLEMGRDEAALVLSEDGRLIRHQTRLVAWEQEPQVVAEGRLWLGADDRDAALDSRWWGPVPADYVQGVVVARWGPPAHRWRGWLSGRG